LTVKRMNRVMDEMETLLDSDTAIQPPDKDQ